MSLTGDPSGPGAVNAASPEACGVAGGDAGLLCAVTAELCRGCLIADVPAIVGSLDIVMGEIDR